MLKQEFIQKYAETNNLEYKEAHKRINNFIKFTIDVLRKEDTLVLRGFGTFHKRKRKSHKVYSYQTKELMYSKEKEYIFFKPSTKLLEK